MQFGVVQGRAFFDGRTGGRQVIRPAPEKADTVIDERRNQQSAVLFMSSNSEHSLRQVMSRPVSPTCDGEVPEASDNRPCLGRLSKFP